jgi:hypothetical protein
MSCTSWLRNLRSARLLGRAERTGRRSASVGSVGRFRPQIEALEHRWCPSYSLITSRTALAGTDAIDWGSQGTSLKANPFTIQSMAGVSVSVSKAQSGRFSIYQQSNGFTGNFAPGDFLLHTSFTQPNQVNPITLDFGATAVAAGGAQIQTLVNGTFTAEVQAFDAKGVSLASFTEVGNSTTAADNSAIFIGISSDNLTIHKIALSVTAAPKKANFFINKFDFRTSPLAAAAAIATPASAVPSPVPGGSLDPSLFLPSSTGFGVAPAQLGPSPADAAPTILLPAPVSTVSSPAVVDQLFAATATAHADAAPWERLALGMI